MKFALMSPAGFFDFLRKGSYLGPVLTVSEVSGCEAIFEACGAAGWPIGWTAYALATAWHETAHTMQPITEFGGATYFRRRYDIEGMNQALARELGNTRPGDGELFRGRGYVQITGRFNYTRADRELKLLGALVLQPEMALEPDIAASIMVRGMSAGWFTGKALKTYLPLVGPGSWDAFLACRRIINGTDKAAEIAQAAMHFQAALSAGRWGVVQKVAA